MEWQTKKLDEVLDIQNGYAFDSKKFSSEGGMPLIRIRDISNGLNTVTNYLGEYKAIYVVRKGDFLIGMDGEFRCHEWKGEDALLNQRVCRLQNFSDKLSAKFLFYGINKYLKDIEDVTGFTTVKHISASQIKNIEFPLPPIPEQQRIVAILDQAFADIDKARANAEQNLKNARELFDSYLQQVFSQRGEGWVKSSLGKEIELLTGYAFKSKDYTEHSQGIPLIRGDNVVQGKIRWDGVKRWPQEKVSEYMKYQLAEGDVLLAMDRTWVKAGMKYTKITSNDLPALLVQRVARMRVHSDFDEDYLFHLLGSKLFENYVLSIQTGLGVPHISGKQIEAFQFQKPPLRMQKEIISNVNQLAADVGRLEICFSQKLTSLDELKKSLLQKAFSGELTKSKGIAA